MEKLTDRQTQILNYIKQYLYKKGYPPSVREICEAVGLKSTSTVHGHLERLERKGYIKRDSTKPRAIEIVDNLKEKAGFVTIPLIGKVTAGAPILAVENVETEIPIPIELINGYIDKDKFYILSVQGDSMINAGILNGDYIIVKQQATADNGDIVVAMIGEEATVKRFFKEKNNIRLQPENPSMQPIITNQVTILGKVVGLFRKIQ
ncbi:repressor LexA [Caldanaerobius fijiensis DSM 17918]|uniref:LexA repressor n=1 Tax=Caldanaerobius fijiensis DSM 17918 TaxID=1121256 RepID=A0A1M4YCU9_9THEO|nr:transcriptional repressor LexA [Caldanaerobius fijiensis]SHF03634.1 repressor LexA [Caldanaerobius fijiensis DSM 17918]